MARHALARLTVRRKAVAVGLSAAVLTGAIAGPAMAATTYTVHKGDTLSGLAKKFGKSSWRTLFNANPDIADPDLIFIGQRLLIPSGNGGQVRHVPAKKVTKIAKAKAGKSHAKKATSRRVSAKRSSSASSAGYGVWDRLARCESGGNWSINTGNGFYGGLQFTLSSWRAVGGSGMPNHASRAEQIARGKRLQQRQGWGAWPACARKLGLR